MEDIFYIKNYQIIKNGKIKIRPGITLITGPSNNGKSSIFKAYKQIIYNLSGNTYINQFADECKLILDNDEYTIEYRKTKTKSSYDIKVVNPETTLHIDKLGVNQIDKVKELTNIDKELGYNFWDQLEKPFLLDRTNREQFLLLQQSPISGNLVNIQNIIKNDIAEVKNDIVASQGGLDIVNKNIQTYARILVYSDDIKKVKEKFTTVDELNNKLGNFLSMIREYSQVEKELKACEEVANINLDSSIEEIYNKFVYYNDKIKEFSTINLNIKNEDTEITKLETEVKNLQKVIEDNFNICPICGNQLDLNHTD